MSLLAGLLSISIALIGVAPSGPAADLKPVTPIRVVSSTHEVKYPSEVLFQLRAESESHITEVTLFYLLGNQNVRVYGYPTFTPGKSISADFTLRTGGSSYLPNGVNIEYYYVILDSSGNTLITPSYSVEYRDPVYQWQQLTVGALTVTWYDMDVERVMSVTADVDERLEPVRELLGLDEVSPMKGVIINSRGEARRGFPPISGAASRGHLYAGFAFDRFDLFVLAGLDPDGMVHEATHLLLDQAVGSPRAKLPAWLNEGLAMYFESNSSRRQASVAQAARRGSLLRLRSMNTQPGRPSDVRTFYSQSWSIVDYMMDVYGRERMSELLRLINSGKRVAEAVPDVYGITLDELESVWKARLTGETTVAPRPDPGTVGTSSLITGAVTLAVAASAYRWWSNRARKTVTAQSKESTEWKN